MRLQTWLPRGTVLQTPVEMLLIRRRMSQERDRTYKVFWGLSFRLISRLFLPLAGLCLALSLGNFSYHLDFGRLRSYVGDKSVPEKKKKNYDEYSVIFYRLRSSRGV